MNNAAELIRPDCVLIDFAGRPIDSTEIQNRKRFLKEQIHQTLNGDTEGKTVYVGFNRFDWVVPIMLAVWELGGNVFVHDLNYEFTRIPEFADFYNFIDLSIVPDKKTFTQFATPAIDPRGYYNGIYHVFDDSIEISATTVAMKTHTSGTTGRPRIIDFTHQHLIDRTQVIASYHGYNGEDKPFHFKTFHHGALFIDYALPLLSVAAEHYFIDPLTPAVCGDNYNAKTYLNLVMPYIRDNRITAILMPYEWINYFDQATPVDLEGRLSIRTLRGYDAKTATWIFENINPKEIVNQFGCSELGTMFISRVTQDNYKNYIHNLFTERAPGLEYVLEKNLVRSRRAGYEWHILADGFIENGDQLYYQGRSYAFATDDTPIYIQDLENYLRTLYHPTKFQLVPDFVDSKLYLALFDPTLDTDINRINELIVANVSPRHCVADIRYFNLRDVVTGIKPSGQILLYAFTKDQNDIQSH
jgi:hypothetical protein